MKYFSINELTSSATALREGIDNRPNKCAYHLLHVLVDLLLDPIREAWGEPIVVSSGYRCKQLNALVGGAKYSHHILGCAADIIAGNRADHRRLFRLIVKMQQEGRIKFTQLIWEGDGFLLLYKRLLDGRYQWPRTKQEVMEMTQEQFEWLMSGQTITPTIRKTKPKSMA